MSENVLSGLAAAQQAVDSAATDETPAPDELGILGQVAVQVSAELGRIEVPFREVAAMHPGKVIELDKEPDSPFTVLVNGTPFAYAEAVVVDGRIGLRILDMVKS